MRSFEYLDDIFDCDDHRDLLPPDYDPRLSFTVDEAAIYLGCRADDVLLLLRHDELLLDDDGRICFFSAEKLKSGVVGLTVGKCRRRETAAAKVAAQVAVVSPVSTEEAA